jgi:hypothetical protein
MASFFRRRRDLGKDEEARAFAELHIAGNDRLSGVEELEIYREQFWFRHTDSLVEDFPGVGGIIGQEAWQRLVEEYLDEHPPLSSTLRDLGDRLPAFIQTRTWLAERALTYDMARLEWAHVEVFDAEDVPRLDPAKLATVPEDAWETARLVSDPGLRVLHFEYPVVALRQELLKAKTSETSIALPDRRPNDVAVHRRLYLIHHDALSPDAFALLSRLATGTPLGQACAEAAASVGISVEALGQNLEAWFADWARRGYLVDVAF